METSQTAKHANKKTGYPLLTRDAAPMLDAMIHSLTASGNGFALINTAFRFGQMDIRIKPAKADRDVVFEAAREAFKAGGWHYGSEMADPADEPSRPVTSMTFRHPRLSTRIGEPLPPRPARMGFEMNLPDPSSPLTQEMIDYYANYASEITRSILVDLANKERLLQPIPLHDALDDDRD
jgi:hypothetical protein